jgi:2-keto-4-pentenoate hydratase/2-oxohepta-3-ene-1,7-dioic acid hydratase in catechol pathway
MFFDIDTIIEYVSKFMTLKKGDLIYTGTPAGVGKIEPGDLYQGYLNGQKTLELRVL